MRWLLIGYMFLFIDRPFEVWPWLGDMHIERIYMLLTIIAWTVYPYKRWISNPQHAAYAGFALAVRHVLADEPVLGSRAADRRGLVQDRRLLLPARHVDSRRGGLAAHRGRVPGGDGAVHAPFLSRIPRGPAHVPHGHRAHDRRRSDARRPEQLRREHCLRAADRCRGLEGRDGRPARAAACFLATSACRRSACS